MELRLKISWRTISLCLLLCILEVNCVIRRRYFHDGILYENYHPDSENVRFSVTIGQWNNLDHLVHMNNLTRKAMFCARGMGIWLMYPDVDFTYGSKSHELQLVSGENCQPADEIMSIQPLGPLNFKVGDTVAAVGFSEKYFAAPAKMVENGTDAIKSMIFLGEGMWTVTGGEKPICVSSMTSSSPVCLVEDTETAFSSSSIQVTRGCAEGDKMEEYGLQTCYSDGFHKIMLNMDFPLPGIQKVCSGAYEETDDTKDRFLKVMDIWEKRLVRLFDAVMIIPDKTNDTEKILELWRSGIINYLANIFSTSCTTVSGDYLDLIVYIFVNMHLKKTPMWTDEPPPGSQIFFEMAASLERTYWYLESCHNAEGPKFEAGCTPMGIDTLKSIDEVKLIEDFLTNEDNDFVIEQMWLIMNYVNAYCSSRMGHVDNQWAELPLVFKKEFMYPLREQWKNPGKWATYYPLMFSGFDLNFERKHSITCLQIALMNTPLYDPISRPSEFYGDVNTTAIKDALGKFHSTKLTAVQQEINNVTDTNTQNRTKREPEDEEDNLVSEDNQKSHTSNVIKTTSIPITTTTNPATLTTAATSSYQETTTSISQSQTQGPTKIAEEETSKPKRKMKKRPKKAKKSKKKGKRKHSKPVTTINEVAEVHGEPLQETAGSAVKID